MPRRVDAAPWSWPFNDTKTAPLAGAVNVKRRFVVSIAVIARSDAVEADAAVTGIVGDRGEDAHLGHRDGLPGAAVVHPDLRVPDRDITADPAGRGCGSIMGESGPGGTSVEHGSDVPRAVVCERGAACL